MAVIGAAIPLIVSDTLTRSSGIPANASSMSASVSIAIPTRPTSPSARGSSESRPNWVGRSKATFSASCPCAIKYLNRLFVSFGVPKPTYWRIVQSRSRYMPAWIPRVNGYSPGRPMSRSKSTSARSSGPYTGLIGNPACARISFMASPTPRESHGPLERLDDFGQRRAHRERARDAEPQELLDIARRDDAANDDPDLGGAVRAQAVDDPAREDEVGAREHRQPDDVHVLLNRRLHDLLWRPLEPGVDDLDPGVAERLRHDLRAAVVAVEPRLGDQSFHASSRRRPRTRPPSTVSRPTATGRLKRRGPALPGLKNSTPSRSSCRGR